MIAVDIADPLKAASIAGEQRRAPRVVERDQPAAVGCTAQHGGGLTTHRHQQPVRSDAGEAPAAEVERDVARLEELKGLLKARDHSTADALARELGVSRRTLHRDLAILRDSGFPIDADRGRGGGMRLHPKWALGRIHFSTVEAIDLLLSIAIAEQVNSPVLLRHLAGIRRKIVAAFGESDQARIRALRKRIFLGPPASEEVAATLRDQSARPQARLAEAFLDTRCVVIEYVDRNGVTTSREIEPQFLYVSMPVWYLLAWDRLRGAIRHFRIDRIQRVTPVEIGFRLTDPRPYIEEIELSVAEL